MVAADNDQAKDPICAALIGRLDAWRIPNVGRSLYGP
jgi:hypothetical protein